MTPQTPVDPCDVHYAMSEAAHVDFSNLITMLSGISMIASESNPAMTVQVKEVAGLASVVHDTLERIFDGLAYVSVQKGRA
jgi:hypothetical protein